MDAKRQTLRVDPVRSELSLQGDKIVEYRPELDRVGICRREEAFFGSFLRREVRVKEVHSEVVNLNFFSLDGHRLKDQSKLRSRTELVHDRLVRLVPLGSARNATTFHILRSRNSGRSPIRCVAPLGCLIAAASLVTIASICLKAVSSQMATFLAASAVSAETKASTSAWVFGTGQR